MGYENKSDSQYKQELQEDLDFSEKLAELYAMKEDQPDLFAAKKKSLTVSVRVFVFIKPNSAIIFV